MQVKLCATLCVLLLSGLSFAQEDVDKKKTTPPPTTTSTTTTTTSTEAPTTAPVPPAPTTPTPKPAPTPKYPGNEGRWSLEDDKNATCIMIKGALEIVFKSVDNKTASVDVPMTAASFGDCSTATINLKWNASSGLESWIAFSFEKNETIPKSTDKLLLGEISGGKYALQNVTGNVYIDTLNRSETFSILKASAFQTPINHSYSCLVQEELKNENVTLKMSDVRIEAFMSREPGHREFSAAIDCPADDSGDVVPIAVGAALAGLVVIVLIAYLIGRRRSRARGYQSV